MRKLLLTALSVLAISASAQVSVLSNIDKTPKNVQALSTSVLTPTKMMSRGIEDTNTNLQLFDDEQFDVALFIGDAATPGQNFTVCQYINPLLAKRFVGASIAGIAGMMQTCTDDSINLFVAADPTDLENAYTITYINRDELVDKIKTDGTLQNGIYSSSTYGVWYASYNIAYTGVSFKEPLLITEDMAEKGFFIGYNMLFSSDASKFYSGRPILVAGVGGTHFADGHYMIINGNATDVTNYTLTNDSGEATPVDGSYIYAYTDGAAGLEYFDVAVSGDNVSRCIDGDGTVVNVDVRNMGKNNVENITFNVSVDGGANFTQDCPTNLHFGEKATISFELDDTKISGNARHAINLTVKSLSGTDAVYNTSTKKYDNNPASGKDTFTEDNSASTTVIVLNKKNAYERKFVVEEITSNGYGYAPFSAIGINNMIDEYEDAIIPISIHVTASANGTTDPYDMSGTYLALLQQSDGFLSYFNRFWGSGHACLGSSWNEIDGVFDDVDNLTEIPGEVEVAAGSTVTADAINVTSYLTFGASAAAGAYGISYVITEDGLPITQLNSYSGSTEDYGNADLNALKNETKMWETTADHVARYNSDVFGTETLLGKLTEGCHYTNQISIPLDGFDYEDLNNCNLIVLVIDQNSFEIVNACSVKLGEEADLTGIEGNTVVAPVVSSYFDLNPWIRIQNGHKYLRH